MEPPKAPIVNVWSVRKEQLAARATSSTTNQPAVSNPPPQPASSNKSPLSTSTTSRTQTKAGTSTKVPPVTDKESWPEVTASLSKDANGKEKENDRGVKEQPPKKGALHSGCLHRITHCSTEKAKKWVPIPVEELQATADALKASSSSNRRGGSGKGDGATRKNPQRGMSYAMS